MYRNFRAPNDVRIYVERTNAHIRSSTGYVSRTVLVVPHPTVYTLIVRTW
eukprot:COSAG02_NODE_2150_length_9660_cov_45.377889_6_plen_50_part_00